MSIVSCYIVTNPSFRLMNLPPAQNVIVVDDVLVTTKGYVRASEVLTGLPRHAYSIDASKSMIQLHPVGFVSAFNGASTGRDLTIPRWNPLHLGSDNQQVVSPMVFVFGATVRDATGRTKGGNDLARMDRVAEDRGTDENWGHAVCVHSNRFPGLVGRRERGV